MRLKCVLMPRKSSNSRKAQRQLANDIRDAMALFESLRPQIRITVEQACAHHRHHPQQMELEDFVEEIDMLLRENDYFRLRSFHSDSALGTWLFSVVKHHIGKELRRQNRMVSLDRLSPRSLTSESD